MGSPRELYGCRGLETKNLRPSAKSADSSFSDSPGIDLIRTIVPLDRPSISPPQTPRLRVILSGNIFAKKKRNPQISQISADFWGLVPNLQIGNAIVLETLFRKSLPASCAFENRLPPLAIFACHGLRIGDSKTPAFPIRDWERARKVFSRRHGATEEIAAWCFLCGSVSP